MQNGDVQGTVKKSFHSQRSCWEQKERLFEHSNIKTTLFYTQVGMKDLKKVKSPVDTI